MEQYVYKHRTDCVHIINLDHTFKKLLLVAHNVAAIEQPSEVSFISSPPSGQRAVSKYAHYTEATQLAGRFTSGAFSNQIQSAFHEPRLLIVTDLQTDHKSVSEASYVNIPVIKFTNTGSALSMLALPFRVTPSLDLDRFDKVDVGP